MRPIPASSILAAHLAISERDRKEGRDAYLKTGVAEVDEYVLLGGIRRGAVVGVSGGVEGGGGRGRGRGVVGGGNEDKGGEGGRLVSFDFYGR
jgi:RecA/RadA recombinase